MKTLLTTTFCLTLIINSFCQSSTTQNNLKAVQLLTESYFGKDTTFIYSLGDLFIYEKSVLTYDYTGSGNNQVISIHDSVDAITGDTITLETVATSISEDEPHTITKRSQYFVHHKDSSYGFNYDTSNIFDIKRVPIDKGRGFTFFSPEDRFVSITPDSTIWNIDSSEIKQVYIEPAKKDTPAFTLVFFFRKNLDLPLTISDVLSKDRKMTLYKMQVKFDEFFDKRINQTVPPHTAMDFELREYFPKDTKEIMKYFERYKIDVEEKSQ